MHPPTYLQVQAVVWLWSICGTLGSCRGREMKVAASGAAVRPDWLQWHFLAALVLVSCRQRIRSLRRTGLRPFVSIASAMLIVFIGFFERI